MVMPQENGLLNMTDVLKPKTTTAVVVVVTGGVTLTAMPPRDLADMNGNRSTANW